ncbi:DUF4157 domain-containing protein [Undibacterium sp. CY18W]|uniref:DUF4157 domain-containing protein n=1 Tax=Undibacterium hunanense TaxID=2762292 RepID=A0ABR6ZU05_9BURK|nr:DUF4157 domain-containing protein [Undibacterium hunanense]MBC3919020.1 DUF4157 domain-containing protein [Undibacterium hunanense]
MSSYAKHASNKNNGTQATQLNASEVRQSSDAVVNFQDDRPQATAQRQIQTLANNSSRALQLKAAQQQANLSPQASRLAGIQALANQHTSQLQHNLASQQKNANPATPVLKPNNTGLPNQLKAGIENLSGLSMDHVHVHYNSAQPAQLQAHAFASGSDIHLAPGQEQHLPHEAWHVVQQAQGRVLPTTQMKGNVPVNDDRGLEAEADVMGARALTHGASVASLQRADNSALESPASHNQGGKLAATSVQLKFDGHSTMRDMKVALNNYPDAVQALELREVHDLIDPYLTMVSNHYPTKLSAKDPTKVEIKKPIKSYDIEYLSKWILKIKDFYYGQKKSEEGFGIDHSSLPSLTKQHNDNWQKFVKNRLDKISLGKFNKSKLNSLRLNAEAAAKRLDGEDPTTASADRDIVNAFAEYVYNKAQSPDIKPSIPVWSTESQYNTGTRVHATYFPGYTMMKGSGSIIKTPIDWFYESRVKDGGSAYYIKGHLLNDHVGGVAKNYNLSPLKDNRNKEHEAGIEHYLKDAVGQMTDEHSKQVTPTYNKIEYTTELGAQTGPRSNTLLWESALNYWNQVKTTDAVSYQSTTLDDVLKDKNVPVNVKTAIQTWSINYQDYTMKDLFSWVKTSALLLETEDYLVRDWTVHLRLSYSNNKVEDRFVVLKNEKIDGDKVSVKERLYKDTKGVGNIVKDTDKYHKDRPTAIKHFIHNLGETDRLGLTEFISSHQLHPGFDIMDMDLVEQSPDIGIRLLSEYDTYVKNLPSENKSLKSENDEISLKYKKVKREKRRLTREKVSNQSDMKLVMKRQSVMQNLKKNPSTKVIGRTLLEFKKIDSVDGTANILEEGFKFLLDSSLEETEKFERRFNRRIKKEEKESVEIRKRKRNSDGPIRKRKKIEVIDDDNDEVIANKLPLEVRAFINHHCQGFFILDGTEDVGTVNEFVRLYRLIESKQLNYDEYNNEEQQIFLKWKNASPLGWVKNGYLLSMGVKQLINSHISKGNQFKSGDLQPDHSKDVLKFKWLYTNHHNLHLDLFHKSEKSLLENWMYAPALKWLG